ncbi:hypothetical protein CAPN004_10170 [Capnocytophaga cynodegmi]|uniref:hypothetical protein n=1 Tax=Capnocytophaga cynodegmi TaxID=28189 RepID=UPI001ACAB5CE|nr:hypothetical protein [Capnocytophaga cynodegmi]GIM51987.1 hypothetical protein CAPN004_10170 [Capnocytophaga cynodegmi]
MDLSEFIRETLNSVVGGVVLSQDDLKNTNARINPSTINVNGFIDSHGKRKVTNISFDVAVTVEAIDEKRKGLKIAVAEIVSAGRGSETKTANQVVSRISFEVPVLLPIKDTLTEEGIKQNQRNSEQIAAILGG